MVAIYISYCFYKTFDILTHFLYAWQIVEWNIAKFLHFLSNKSNKLLIKIAIMV